MARYRTAARRTVASVLSNPRKTKRKAPRLLKRNPRKRRSSSKRRSYRASSKRRGKRRTRRNPTWKLSSKRSKGRTYRMSSKSKSGWKRNPGPKRHRRYARKRFGKRRGRMSSASFRSHARLSNPRRRRRGSKRRSYRRNPGLTSSVRKLPLVGGPLAAALAATPLGLLAGISTEIPMRLAPIIASQAWIPDFFKTNEFAYFTATSALAGGVIAAGLNAAGMKKLPLGLSVGLIPGLMTAAGAGAGWVKMRSRQVANDAGIATPEQQVAGDDAVAGMGALLLQSPGMGLITASPMGMGPAYSVAPGGFASNMGAVLVGS